MRRFLVLAFGMLVLFGCLAAPQGQTNNTQQVVPDTTPPADTNPPASDGAIPTDNTNQSNPRPSCSEYCMSQPHIECVGEWNISGAYPDCVCGFVCETNDADNQQTTNNSQSEDTNQSTPPPGYTIIPTDRSVSQMIDDELVRIKDDFYSAHDGSFTENSYRWERIVPLGDSFSTAPASDVKLDGKTINSIEASAFIVFQDNADDSEDISGVAIFRARSTILDNYTTMDSFEIEYFPPLIDKHLRGCWIDAKDYNMDMEGDWLITYRFQCERA